MSRKDDALAIMPKYLAMIDGDLMKVAHYLKDGVKAAIVAEDRALSEKLAEFFIEAEDISKRFTELTERGSSK